MTSREDGGEKAEVKPEDVKLEGFLKHISSSGNHERAVMREPVR